MAPGEPSAQVPIEGGAGRSALTVSCGLRHPLVDDPLPGPVDEPAWTFRGQAPAVRAAVGRPDPTRTGGRPEHPGSTGSPPSVVHPGVESPMFSRSGVAVRWWSVTAAVAVLLAGCTHTIGSPPDGGTMAASAVDTPAVADDSVIPRGVLPFPEPAGTVFSVPRRAALQAALDTVMRGWAGLDFVKGVSVAVVAPDGSWAGVSGNDGAGVPLVPDAMTDIGSVSKTVTAAEVLSLAEAGHIDLDAPASTYLADPLLHLNPTVRELLSHTSGIPDFAAEKAFDDAVFADGTRRWTPAEALGYATGPVTAPDEHPTDPAAGYSSSNYLLLGLIIERVTGLTYAQAVRRDVLTGIGPRMAIQDAEIPVPPVATAAPAGGALPDGSYLPNRAWATALGAAGGIAADAPTLATWGYQLYGGHILTSETTRLMTTPVTIGYGLGTTLTNTTVGHPGLVPSYASLLTVIPADRISIAILLVGYMDTPALISLRNSIQIAMRT